LVEITKRYEPETVAVDGLTLEVADGEFLVLLGPSGCGKSTVLRLIAGLERPDAGSIEIGDHDVVDVDAKDRDVAMVFQSYALYPHMTVRQNIAFALKPVGVPRHQRDLEAERVAAELDITELLERKPRQLSGGQQQRVALARALVRRPSAFLMDEPLSNLDAQLRTQTRADLVQLQREIGTTFVYVTHDQVEALTMADRIAVLSAGRLQQLGTPEEVYDRPANTFVAGFVGSPPMNLWPVTIDRDGAARIDGVQVAVAPDRGEDRAMLGVRPEHVRVLPGGTGGVTGTVAWTEDLGHEHLLGGELDAGPRFGVRWADEAPPPQPGDPVRLAPDPGALHWFDHDTGERWT
jgi:multiple sugar transport system ATP-binding protein